MLIIPNPSRRRRRRAENSVPVPVSGPMLVSAVYETQTSVTLTFAHPVTVTVDMMSAVHLTDGQNGEAYEGEGFELLSATRIRVDLFYRDSFTGVGVTMTVTPPTGIVDAGTDEPWAGVTDLSLPFP